MLTSLDMLALIAVMLVGLPHGAFDGAIAFCLGMGRSTGRIIGFVIIYLVLAGLFVMVWSLSAVFALACFVILSIVHFGSCDAQAVPNPFSGRLGTIFNYGVMFAHGGIVTICLSNFHPDEVDRLFSVLAGNNAFLVTEMLAILWPVWLVSVMIYTLVACRYHRLFLPLAEIAILSVLMAILPPLAGFAVYFCLVHSRRHFLSIFSAMKAVVSVSVIIKTAMALTVSTWIIGAIGFLAQTQYAMLSIDDAALRTVFILLAALTLPHMILVDGLFRPTMHKLRRKLASS